MKSGTLLISPSAADKDDPIISNYLNWGRVLVNIHDTSASTLQDLSRRIIGDRSFAYKKVNPSNTSVEDRIISGTYSSYLTLGAAF